MHAPLTLNSTSTPTLDKLALAAFNRDGYVLLGSIISSEVLDKLRADEAWLRNRSSSLDAQRSTHFWSLINKHCPAVRDLGINGPHIEAASQVIGPNVALWWNQFVTKMPEPDRAKGTFPWHQDNGYVDVAPSTNVTIWIALDDVDTTNGCVWILPGSHQLGLLPHASPHPDSWHLTVTVDNEGIPVPLKAGEAVMFSGYTLHRSLANAGQRPRRALFLQYADADARLPTKSLTNLTDQPEAWVVRGRASYPRPNGNP